MKKFAKEINRRIDFVEDMLPQGNIRDYSLEEDYILINMDLNNEFLQLRLPYEIEEDRDIASNVTIQLIKK